MRVVGHREQRRGVVAGQPVGRAVQHQVGSGRRERNHKLRPFQAERQGYDGVEDHAG